MRIYHEVEEAQRTILRRRGFDEVEVSPAIQASLDRNFGTSTTPQQAVERIIAEVRSRGDEALRPY